MIIVVNTQSESLSYASYIIDCFVHIAELKPNYQFIFWTPKKLVQPLPNNCNEHLVKKIPSSKLGLYYWCNYQIPSLLKKQKATHYYSLIGILSKNVSISQYTFLPINKQGKKQQLLPLHLQKLVGKNASLSLQIAKKIIVFSHFEKTKIIQDLTLLEASIDVLPIAANANFSTLFWEKQQDVKDEFTNGKDYFLANMPDITKENFVTILKAFTQFKTWQKSSLQLIINSTNFSVEIENLLASYKYKEDVVLMPTLLRNKYAALLASAYAFLYVDGEIINKLPILEAMQCQVPVITSNYYKNIFESSIASVDLNDNKSIASKLILLYKDEAERNNIITKGFDFSTKTTYTQTIQTLLSYLN